eukprot:2633419-Pyramimonas_sp.AAC.1
MHMGPRGSRASQQPQHSHLVVGWKKCPNLIMWDVLFRGQGPSGASSPSSITPGIPGGRGPAPGMAGAAQPSGPVPCCPVDMTPSPASSHCPLRTAQLLTSLRSGERTRSRWCSWIR